MLDDGTTVTGTEVLERAPTTSHSSLSRAKLLHWILAAWGARVASHRFFRASTMKSKFDERNDGRPGPTCREGAQQGCGNGRPPTVRPRCRDWLQRLH